VIIHRPCRHTLKPTFTDDAAPIVHDAAPIVEAAPIVHDAAPIVDLAKVSLFAAD
jgi:hypothetical protein